MRWLGERLWNADNLDDIGIDRDDFGLVTKRRLFGDVEYYGFDREIVRLADGRAFNTTCIPERIVPSNIADVIDTNADEKVFISPVGCKGILRRAEERRMNMNPRLAEIMREISSELPADEIERISRIQPRGAFSERQKKKDLRRCKAGRAMSLLFSERTYDSSCASALGGTSGVSSSVRQGRGMTECAVEITPEAEADLENIWGYIACELEAGESAYKIVDDLYTAIAKLDAMPKRFRVINREPWKSRGVRFMFVDSYRVHYIVDDAAQTVTMLRVMYCRTNS